MEPIRVAGPSRFWDPAKSSGLSVIDIPPAHVQALGGLKRQRVQGTLGGIEYASNVMPAGNGRLALSASRAMMASASLAVADDAQGVITKIGRD